MEGTGLYAYGFRYYDPVIGRFTGVDPIADQFAGWSGYNYVLGNPVALIDPDGRSPKSPLNDYFDQNGNYLGSDNRGYLIKIVWNSTIDKASNLSRDKMFSRYNEEGQLFSDYKFEGEKGLKSLGNIGQYYMDRFVEGSCGVKCFGSDNFNLPMQATSPDRMKKEPHGVSIFKNAYTDKIDSEMGPLMNNYYNFSNMLYHEKRHIDKQGVYRNGRYLMNDLSNELHINIFQDQESHWTWEHTTPEFKKDRDARIKDLEKQ